MVNEGIVCSGTHRESARYGKPTFVSGGRRIDPSWSGPIELFLVPASAP